MRKRWLDACQKLASALPAEDARRLQDRYRQAVIERDTLAAANTTLLLERNKLQAQVNRLLHAVDEADDDANFLGERPMQRFTCARCGSELHTRGLDGPLGDWIVRGGSWEHQCASKGDELEPAHRGGCMGHA